MFYKLINCWKGVGSTYHICTKVFFIHELFFKNTSLKIDENLRTNVEQTEARVKEGTQRTLGLCQLYRHGFDFYAGKLLSFVLCIFVVHHSPFQQ